MCTNIRKEMCDLENPVLSGDLVLLKDQKLNNKWDYTGCLLKVFNLLWHCIGKDQVQYIFWITVHIFPFVICITTLISTQWFVHDLLLCFYD